MFKGLTPMIVATVFLAGATSAAAQQPALPASVDSGKLVRLYTATSMIHGRLTAPFRRTESPIHFCRFPGRPCLGVEDSADVRTIPTSAVERLEVSPGSHWRRGATIGGVFGAVAGGLTGAFIYAMCEQDCPKSKTPLLVLGGLVNGLAFGALGALWGSAFPRWVRRE